MTKLFEGFVYKFHINAQGWKTLVCLQQTFYDKTIFLEYSSGKRNLLHHNLRTHKRYTVSSSYVVGKVQKIVQRMTYYDIILLDDENLRCY